MIELIKYIMEDMNKQLDRIEKSMNQLNDELIWKRMKGSMKASVIFACIWQVTNIRIL